VSATTTVQAKDKWADWECCTQEGTSIADW